MNEKTYGRNTIRSGAKKYQRKLVTSWGVCFLVGFLIGCVIMSGFVHIFTCIDVVSAENAPVPSATPEPTPTPIPIESEMVVKRTTSEQRSLGVFKLTAYCACSKCCGKSDGITASGVKAVEGVTIAADTRVLPFGTKVIINGHEYIVQDKGGSIKGNRIDVYFDSHQKALEFGVQHKEIFIAKDAA